MQKKQMLFKTRGMNKDLSVSVFSPEFVFDNRNLRLSTNEGNTLMSWVNEKGTSSIIVNKKSTLPITTLTIEGITIGTAIINDTLVLFTTTNTGDTNTKAVSDRIYKLEMSDSNTLTGELIYQGNLNFSANYPLETQVSYESSKVQKVYWTDKRNQPRLINIKGKVHITPEYIDDDQDESTPPVLNTPLDIDSRFDFVPELQLSEEVTVQKLLGASGTFAPGVIQYAFTYYNKYGQETNIFYTTPLYYISHRDRGASPEDKVENAFKITVSHLDMNFEYLRIYSIQRTSVNGVPYCKRIQDIELSGTEEVEETDISTGETVTYYKTSFIDTGTTGNNIDPTELLYKGGESILVETMEQKDGTLFMGNIKIDRKQIEKGQSSVGSVFNQDTIVRATEIVNNVTRNIYPTIISDNKDTSDSNAYRVVWHNQLTSYSDSNNSVSTPCSTFKYGDYYRLGIQFQYKTGKWSDPIYIKDDVCSSMPSESSTGDTISLPIFRGYLNYSDAAEKLLELGYRKLRPVVVFPNMIDRATICQGVVNPTLYKTETQSLGSNYGTKYQSDWFFRPPTNSGYTLINNNDGTVSPKGIKDQSGVNILNYTSHENGSTGNNATNGYNPANIKSVEIQGDFAQNGNDTNSFFNIDPWVCTLHSPEIEFNDELSNISFSGLKYKKMGNVDFINTLSDIEIQTETPTISNNGSGFVHKSFNEKGTKGIVSGLFYDDFCVNDKSSEFVKWNKQKSPYKWMVYLWNRGGSLNNDVTRPANKGVASALLKKKIISNLRFGKTALSNPDGFNTFSETPQIFNDNQGTVVKLGKLLYTGNVDTMLMPTYADGNYFAFAGSSYNSENINTPFNQGVTWKTFYKYKSTSQSSYDDPGVWMYENVYENGVWGEKQGGIGDDYIDLAINKQSVRMKYKSSPHLIFKQTSPGITWNQYENTMLPIIDVCRDLSDDIPSGESKSPKTIFEETIFGGQSKDALKENNWVPCGDPVRLDAAPVTVGLITGIPFDYSYGDTYFQRYDCLKTYAFTREDINQVVEIGSFMLETHVNIDGRYDRNRGQQNNLNMSPQNFNLINPVYSQIDNFFTYKIQDDDVYEQKEFKNQITWSKTKTSGEEVDSWTNTTLASILELDGDKGAVTKLARLNNNLICFQDRGISQILYNENSQISTTEGVPIEIANSGKVNGKRYLSDTIGCSNKWSVVNTLAGIYFMDNNDKSIYLFNGELTNISASKGFNTWCKQHIMAKALWKPWYKSAQEVDDTDSSFVSYYDSLNQDILFINKDEALAYSEKLGAFTSFYDYGRSPYFCNLNDAGIWLRNDCESNNDSVTYKTTLWKHQGGDYCRFFGENKPYSMILVGNPEPQSDKLFTNLEFRACVEGDCSSKTEEGEVVFDNFYLPFDSLETWNEYQHGYTSLENKSGHSAMLHGTNSSALKRKFRIWRCDIPRDNCDISGGANYASDSSLGVSRLKKHSMDRMRNPWIYLKLKKNKETSKHTVDGVEVDNTLPKTEIHDVQMIYFN